MGCSWFGRSRRLAKDWEKSIASSEAWMLVAHIRLLTHRLTRHCYVSWSFKAGSKSPTRKELSGFSWLWFCPVARLNGATHALD